MNVVPLMGVAILAALCVWTGILFALSMTYRRWKASLVLVFLANLITSVLLAHTVPMLTFMVGLGVGVGMLGGGYFIMKCPRGTDELRAAAALLVIVLAQCGIVYIRLVFQLDLWTNLALMGAALAIPVAFVALTWGRKVVEFINDDKKPLLALIGSVMWAMAAFVTLTAVALLTTYG